MMLKLPGGRRGRIRWLRSPSFLRKIAWFLVIVFIIVAAGGLVLQVRAGTSYTNLGFPLLVISLIPVGIWPVVGALVVSSHPRHPVGWLLCIGLIGAPIDMFSAGYAAYDSLIYPGKLPGITLALIWLSSGGAFPFANTAFTLMLLFFPNGRFPSTRWRIIGWTAVAALLLYLPLKGLQPGPVDPSSGIYRLNPLGVATSRWTYLEPLMWSAGGVMFLSYAAALLSLIVRRRQSRGEQRQQIKWVVYPAALYGLSIPFLLLSVAKANDLILNIGIALGLPAIMGIVIAVAFAIFKYRLYDIDLIINLTLVYGVLTGTLALIYFVSIVLLQRILPAESPVTIALSTLAVVALFSPLRRRIQNGIDRRFYRRKYDAREILDSFNTEIRDEVELERLAQALVVVVDETLRPTHVSLWLKEDNS